MNTSLVPGKHDPYAALRIKDFRLFIFTRLAFIIGIQMQIAAVAWQVTVRTGNPLSLGFIGLAEAIPAILVALYAGHVADTANRKKVVSFALLTLCLCSLALYFLSWNTAVLDHFGLLPIYATIFVTGVARGFMWPSAFAFMTQLIPRELYSNSSTWNSATWHTGDIAGPAIGGLTIALFGMDTTYLLSAGLILFSILIFFLIPSRPHPETNKAESLTESLKSGIKFVFGNQVILGALSLDLFAVLFGGARILLPLYTKEVLHAGPEIYGILSAASPAGAIGIALFLAYFPPLKNAGKKLLWCVAGFGASICCFAFSQNFWLAWFFLCLSGMFDNVSVVVRATIIQTMTPDSMRGRVASVNNIFIGSSNEIGAFESGVMARLMGLIPSIALGGIMTLLVVYVLYKVAPKLRTLDLGRD